MTESATGGRTVPLEALLNAFAMRAAAYAHIFDVLRERYGTDSAVGVLAEATHRLGEANASRFAAFAPADLAGLRDAFLAHMPAPDALFAPEVTRCDADRLEIKFHSCPLKNTWQKMGRSEADIELLCHGASAIDHGLFTAAGFVFKGEHWHPGRDGCCLLRIEPGQPATAPTAVGTGP
jgi:hypothetical protein